MKRLLLLALVAFAQGDTSQALAVAPSSHDRSVCNSDVDLFCAAEKSSSRCAQFKCLKTHLEQLSAPCATYLREKLARKENCKNDTAAFCPNEESHYGIRRCLIQHVDQLTNAECASYIREKMSEYAKEVSLTACDADATTLCSSATGFSGTLLCIKQNYDNLSKDCRRFLWKVKNNGTSHEHGYHRHEHGSYRHHHERGDRHGDSEKGEGWKWHGHGHESGKWDKNREKNTEKAEKKSGKCTRKLKKHCDSDLTALCPKIEELGEMKKCLALKYATLSADCADYLLNPKKYWKSSKQEEVTITSSAINQAPVDTITDKIDDSSDSESDSSAGSEGSESGSEM